MSISTTLPRIVAYWTGYQRIDDEIFQPFDPSHPVPGWVHPIDTLVLAFALVKDESIQYTCASDETCLANGQGYWTQEEIASWLGQVRTDNPNMKVLLSIGGAWYNDWATVTNPDTFAANTMSVIKDTFVTQQGEWLLDGIDIDYESTDPSHGTNLPYEVSFISVVKSLIAAVKTTFPGEPLVSMPYYGGSPWSYTDPQFIAIQNELTFISTMGYGDGTGDYDGLVNHGYRASKGFSYQSQTPNEVRSIIGNSNPQVESGMYWNLSSLGQTGGNYSQPAAPLVYIDVMDATLPRT